MVSQDTISLRSNGDIQELLTWVHRQFLLGVPVTWSLVLYVCFVDRCCPFVLFSFVLSVLLRFWFPFGILKFILDMLVSLFNWTTGMNKIQLKKNRNDNVGIKWPPYATMFGCAAEIGLLKTPIPNEILQVLQNEED